MEKFPPDTKVKWTNGAGVVRQGVVQTRVASCTKCQSRVPVWNKELGRTAHIRTESLSYDS